MDLKTFLDNLPKGGRAKLAARCGASAAYLQQISVGRRNCPGWLAVAIERETGGAVIAEILDPKTDWAYIRGTARSERAAA